MADVDLERAMDVACRACETGGAAAIRHWRTGVAVETKPDHSPVTVADREAERAIVAVIEESFPDHDILGEESGEHDRGSDWRWIIDPLDGTRGFTRGMSFWGPLVALTHEGRAVASAMQMPVLEKTYWAARGLGCYRDGEKLQVSSTTNWSEAVFMIGEMSSCLAAPHGKGVQKLIDDAFSSRCYGDVAGCASVLDGVADAWIEAGIQIWDIAPYQVMLEEAGGQFTDFAGQETLTSGNAAGTNTHLHPHVLTALTQTS